MLENPRSPRVRAVAKLTKRSARQETGLFLVEGPQAAREILAYKPETVLDIVDGNVDRILDLLGLPAPEAKRWVGAREEKE